MTTYWVSFATDEKFLGVAVVDMDAAEPDILDIIRKTIRLGCNPGDGSVQVHRVPDGMIPDGFKNRLLGRDEVEHLKRQAEKRRREGWIPLLRWRELILGKAWSNRGGPGGNAGPFA